ncbi:MAG: flagellar biosynthesis anti-sigma factor FlgM [Bryobacteraceae bacterium]|jgi:anti-sigma28 factor (negative regulator of flagellin synthesis)
MRLHLDPATTRPVDTGQATAIAGAAPASTAVRGQGNSGSGDSIAISGPSAALSQISSQRAARLESLSAAVGNGTYQVSSSAIGGAIVAHAAK